MTETSHGNRRSKRAEVAMGATCRTDTGRKSFVAVIDLTPAGCCIFAREEGLVLGEKVTLRSDGISAIKGVVKWTNGLMAGVAFDKELYAPVFEHLARTHPWRLSEMAKDALNCNATVPAVVQRELNRMIDRAEKVLRERDASHDVLSTRPLYVTPRPGFAPKQTNPGLVRLFLT